MPQYSTVRKFPAGEEVRVVRWPVEMAKLEQLRRLGALRLLVVESGSTPPVPPDMREDWILAPVSRADFAARIAALKARAEAFRVPVLDQDGLLHYGGQVAPLSPTEMDLIAPLVERLGCLVARGELIARLSARRGRASQNALDLHIMRIRRRVDPLGLGIRTISGRGYLLEVGE